MQPRTFFLCLALILLASSPKSALSQVREQLEPPGGVFGRTNDDLNLKRDVTFELSEQEETIKLFRADPRLFEQRYAAYVELSRPRSDEGGINLHPLVPDRLKSLLKNSLSLLYADVRVAKGVSHREVFRRLTESIDDVGSHGRQDALDFFLSPAVDEGFVRVVLLGKEFLQFRILAPTEESAKQRALALIWLPKEAVSQPLQKQLREDLDAQQEHLPALQQQLEGSVESLATLQKKVESVEDIEADELSRLKTERRLLDVDVAGQRGRIGAVEEAIARYKGEGTSSDRIRRLEDIKITAEIELVSLAARREAFGKLIKQGMSNELLRGKVTAQENENGRLKVNIIATRSQRDMIKEALDIFATQLFALKDGKVRLTPIKWTE